MADFDTPETNDTAGQIMIDPADLDRSRIVLHPPHTSKFKIGNATIENTTSEGRYLDDDGNECKLYFAAPPQMCFGTNYIFPLDLVNEEDKTPDKAQGVQIQYPMTSLQSITSPTPAEQALMDCLMTLYDLSLESAQAEMLEDPLRIPDVSYSSFVAAEKRNNWANAFKLPFEHPKESGKKTFDTTKPKRMYPKLKTTGKGDKLRVHTPFYGPGDVQESPLKYLNVRGIITPCFEWEGIYWGMHGTAPHGASLRFKVVEANFVPQSGGAADMPGRRMLPKNTAAKTATDDDASVGGTSNGTDADEEPEEGTFTKGNALGKKPGGDAKSPSSALSAAAKSKGVPAKGTTKAAPVAKKAAPAAKGATKVAAAKKAAPPAKVAKAAPPAKKAAPAAKGVAKKAAPPAKGVAKKAAPSKVAKRAPPPPPEEEEGEEDEVVEEEGVEDPEAEVEEEVAEDEAAEGEEEEVEYEEQ